MCRSTPAAVATITRPYLATVTNHATALATLPTRRSGDPELRPGFAQRADKGQRPRRRYLPPEDGPGRGARARWSADGRWIVRARIERFVEPAVLLLLRDGPRHGYDLLERIPDLAGGEGTVDLGNLYRLLRALEREGLVTSEWDSSLPGPAKRTYELTASGRDLLDGWAEALRDAGALVEGFLDRYDHVASQDPDKQDDQRKKE
jgi:PadR family transcriptional regulator PadR